MIIFIHEHGIHIGQTTTRFHNKMLVNGRRCSQGPRRSGGVRLYQQRGRKESHAREDVSPSRAAERNDPTKLNGDLLFF